MSTVLHNSLTVYITTFILNLHLSFNFYTRISGTKTIAAKMFDYIVIVSLCSEKSDLSNEWPLKIKYIILIIIKLFLYFLYKTDTLLCSKIKQLLIKKTML